MNLTKAAELLGKDRNTVKNWINNPQLRKFFSKNAEREVDDGDYLVLNTIKVLQGEGVRDWQEIAERMDSGYRASELGFRAAVVDTGETPIQIYANQLSLRQQLDVAEKRAEYLESQITNEREEHAKEKERLLREIASLNREIGRLEGQSKANS